LRVVVFVLFRSGCRSDGCFFPKAWSLLPVQLKEKYMYRIGTERPYKQIQELQVLAKRYV
jgi:hypothetical protein